MTWKSLALLLVLAAAPALSASAQADHLREMLLAKRAAEADAYRKLAEALRGLRIDATTTLGAAAAASDEIRATLDASLRLATLRHTRFVDGVCEVEATLDVEAVAKRLQSQRVSLLGDKSDGRRTLRVIGRGAPRIDLPPTLPADILDRLAAGQSAASDNEPAELPAIWAAIAPAERLMALEAARKDAQRRLGERVAGLRIIAETGVADFTAVSDAVRLQTAAIVTGAEEIGRPYYAADAAIVQIRMRLPSSGIVETIGASANEPGIRAAVKRDIEVVGTGVPREGALRAVRESRKPAGTSEIASTWPPWAEQELVGEARAGDADIATPQGKLRAARAADHAARRKLAETIATLPLGSGTVGKATLDNELGLRIDGLIGAAAAAVQLETDGATARVTIPAMRVWEIVSDGAAQP